MTPPTLAALPFAAVALLFAGPRGDSSSSAVEVESAPRMKLHRKPIKRPRQPEDDAGGAGQIQTPKMPPLPTPPAEGITEDSFPIAPTQMGGPRAGATARGMTSVGWYTAFYFTPKDEDHLRVYITAADWWHQHDISVECWGEFNSGPIEITADGPLGDQIVELGAMVVQPAGKRIIGIIPSAGLSQGYLGINIRDADDSGPQWSIYQCVFTRL